MSAGMGMVPFADMFNHKASIINLSGDYELEGKYSLWELIDAS